MTSLLIHTGCTLHQITTTLHNTFKHLPTPLKIPQHISTPLSTLHQMVKEKSNLVAETLDLRTSLSKAKERTDQEYALRLQMESSVEALKRYMCAHLFVFLHVYPCSVCTRIRVCACVCSYLNSLLSPSAPSYNSARLISLSSPLLFSRASNETRMLTMDSSEREGRTEQLYAQVSEYVCVRESVCVCACVCVCMCVCMYVCVCV